MFTHYCSLFIIKQFWFHSYVIIRFFLWLIVISFLENILYLFFLQRKFWLYFINKAFLIFAIVFFIDTELA
jgi:hypothetical protein